MTKDQIIEILIPWNFWRKDINTGIRRQNYLQRIKKYLLSDEIVAVSGVRRAGKSTILLQTLSRLIAENIKRENTLYVNFEDPCFYHYLKIELLDHIWQAYNEYIKPSGKVYLVLDEVPKVPGWEHWVRTKYDCKENVKIFVTGSNSDLLSSEFSATLTGRHFELAVWPLAFKEFIFFKGVSFKDDKLWFIENKNILANLLTEYLETGGFPKIVLTADESLRRELLLQYFDDIISKDIVQRYKIKDVNKIKSLALFYCTNFTRGWTFRRIKEIADFTLSLDSACRFSHYLEAAFLIWFLPRFSYSLKNQMQTQRKVYLVDNGVHNAVAFKFSENKGKLLENAVYLHLKAQRKEIYYFSEKKEIDFVIKAGPKITQLINVCYNLDSKEIRLREISALVEGMKYFKLKDALLIVGEGQIQEVKEASFYIRIIPFWDWALRGE